MIHTALARKYRPTRFADLVAQDHVAAGLTGAVARNRVAHAYLLTGPRGVGKTTAARILAMALNCGRRAAESGEVTGEPCGECDSCRRIWSGGVNLDVVEIDAASNRGVDDARELRERAMYAASAPGRFKVYIVDEAHMLTREAWNALLKILEEPPPGVVFVFATTEPHKIANTAAPVLSRLQRFDFRRIGPQAIVERLRYVAQRESIDVEDDALRLIARVAQGALRDALSLLDQAVAFDDGPVTARRVRSALGLIDDEMYAELLDVVAERKTGEVFPFVARLMESGADLVEFINGLGEVLRALLMCVVGGSPEGLTETFRAAVDRHARGFTDGDLLRMLKLLGETEGAVRRSPNARLHVEALLLQWTLLDSTVELSDVLRALGADHPGEVASRTRIPAERGRAGGHAPAAPDSGEGEGGSAPPRAGSVPLTLDSLLGAWDDVVERVGRRRRMVREALARARPVAVLGDSVVLEVTDSEVHLEGLERSRDLIADAISSVVAQPVKLTYRPAAGPLADTVAEQPRRLSRQTDRDERLKQYRAKDPTLDAVAEAFDLELLE